jgi:hypothetical protein
MNTKFDQIDTVADNIKETVSNIYGSNLKILDLKFAVLQEVDEMIKNLHE